MGDMQAAVLKAPRQLELVARPMPVAGAGEVVLRVAATAVCHTDLEIYTGNHPGVRYPVVMGHEATGVVAALGPGVSGLAPGQRVLINPIIACGHCDSCARGAENLCRNAGLFGRECDGSLSSYVCLPARYAHALPEHLALDVATIIETLAAVLHSQERVGIGAGDAVVVIGQGATGLLHTRLARIAGADPVIAVSRSPWKLELARRMGAHHAVEGSAQDVVAEVLRLTGNLGADVVVDAAGGPTILPAGIGMLRPGGRFAAFSVSHRPIPEFSTFPLYFKELSIVGSRALLPGDMTRAIELFASGAVDAHEFVTERFPLEHVAAAFKEYEHNPDRVLRFVITSDLT
jgi:2-desacetyl-2-hydroxyethyl bacteriochlorophyllide A dehydrogenase